MRLAHEQGLLTQKSLNLFQRWALLYWIWMDRRMKVEDVNAELEHQCFNLAPERWGLIYRDQLLGMAGQPNGEGEIPIGVDELDELDRYMDQEEDRFQRIINGRHTVSGSDQIEPLSWGAWS